MNEWKSFGDVNPVEHSGLWVKKDMEIEGLCYYVVNLIECYDYDESTERWLLIDGWIDLLDDWIKWDDIQASMDTPIDADDERLVVDCAYYYGSGGEIGDCREFDSREDVIKELALHDIVAE